MMWKGKEQKRNGGRGGIGMGGRLVKWENLIDKELDFVCVYKVPHRDFASGAIKLSANYMYATLAKKYKPMLTLSRLGLKLVNLSRGQMFYAK